MAEPLLSDAPPEPRYCAGCQHVHGGRAFGVCLVTSCPCVAVAARSIDYLHRAEDGRGRGALGVVEHIEMDNQILGGERSAAEIAADIGVAPRTIQRRRKELRLLGYRLVVPEHEWTEGERTVARKRTNLQRRRQS